MTCRFSFGFMSCSGLLLYVLVSGVSLAAGPTAEQALQLQPVQKGISFDLPDGTEMAKCEIEAKKIDGRVAWIVSGPNGQILRQFVDTNGDNVVDQWSYFREGLEVYRDIDANFNGKADQYRWFHTAGSRWGLDTNEDGTIDLWKAISAEEATAEAVAALAKQDGERFMHLALTPEELQSAGLGEEKAKELATRIAALRADFKALLSKTPGLSSEARWVQFGASRPGAIPAGTDGSTADLRVYENVLVLVEDGGKYDQVQIGTLVEIGQTWRVIGVPQFVAEGQSELTDAGFFFRAKVREPASSDTATAGAPSEETQKLLGELQEIDQTAAGVATTAELAPLNARRAELLEQIADLAPTAEDRAQWVHQLADTVSAAVQSGTYPNGAQRLEALFKKLSDNEKERNLAAYVRFRQLTAEYALSLQGANPDFAKIQSGWLETLAQFVADFPKEPVSSEAMLQLAIAKEFAGEEEEAKEWFGKIVEIFPQSGSADKAAGAQTRLDSVGKEITLSGKTPDGKTLNLSQYRGNVVLIQYWASWCEPCKTDMVMLKDLISRYGGDGFSVVGVNLDDRSQDMAAFLASNKLPWLQIHEEGGLDSRPANEMGILTLPTMILVDKKGQVVNRNVHVAELDKEVKNLMR